MEKMDISTLKNRIINTIGENSFNNLNKRLPENYWYLFMERDGTAEFIKILPEIFKSDDIIFDKEAHECWEAIGNFYKNQNRFHEGISIFLALYYHFLDAQNKTGNSAHKGMPLVWISDCYSALRFPVLAKRYLMLTLCEDAIRDKGIVPPNTTGTYFRMVWWHGLPNIELKRYAEKIYKLSQENPGESMYPEWIIQKLDQNWMTDFPSPQEFGIYRANLKYVEYMLLKLGDKSGNSFERLADYILSCMPGCRTTRRRRTSSTDYDIVCSMEGFEVDFRSEMGRYFVCECKDWKKTANFTTMAKFCRVLDSIKARFGILFSKNGISGEGKTLHAEREQLKVFQDRGIVIVVVDQNDLIRVSKGYNFISLLREKYETIRLDLKRKKP